MSERVEMNQERWDRTTAYIRELFARTDPGHASVMQRARAEDMPAIDAGPESGRFLQLMTMASGGHLAVEVGTLAGYSAIWIGRGLAPDGRLITVEASEKHAAIAAREITDAGLADRVQVRLGKGGEVLPALLRETGPGKTDLVFLDAERSEYQPLLGTVHQLLRAGGVLCIDNALHAVKPWIPDAPEPGEAQDVMDALNHAVAADPRFASTVVPLGNGLLVAVKK